MESGADKLVFNINGKRIALDLAAVDSVVDVQRVFFIPGQSGHVKGIISRRGEAVTVVDLRKVFGVPETPEMEEEKNRVVIVSGGGRTLGLYIGARDVSFVWKEGAEEQGKSPEPTEEGATFTESMMEEDGKPVEMLDWLSLYSETQSILSGGEGAGEDTHS